MSTAKERVNAMAACRVAISKIQAGERLGTAQLSVIALATGDPCHGLFKNYRGGYEPVPPHQADRAVGFLLSRMQQWQQEMQ